MPVPFVKRLLLLGAASLIAVLCAELVVRTCAPQKIYRFPSGLYVNHPSRGHALAPGFVGTVATHEFRTRVRINTQGLREERDIGSVADATVRVLFIGDSFTMAYSVESPQTWMRRFEQQLRKVRPGLDVQAVNAGVPGYNTHQAVDYLQHEGILLHPDLVVLGFFIGNDIRDNAKLEATTRVDHGYLIDGVVTRGVLPRPLRQWIALHSHLYHLLWPLQRAVRNQASLEAAALVRANELSIYADPPAQLVARGWELTSTAMKRFAESLNAYGIAGMLVLIPDPVQLADDFLSDEPELSRQTGTSYRRDAPNVRLVDICKRLGLPVLDLLPTFLAAPKSESYYHSLDGHWTVGGNRVAGNALAEFVAERDLVGHSEGRREWPPVGSNSSADVLAAHVR